MSLKYKALMSGEKELLALLGELPDRIQNRVFRHAGRKVGNAIAQRAAALTPKNTGKRKSTGQHLKESFINKQKTYRNTVTTVNIVGVQTQLGHPSRVNHLVEEGTNNRWTGHRTLYRRTEGKWITRNRKVKLASGAIRTVKERVKTSPKVSRGSSRAEYIRQRKARGQSIGGMMYRGRMPAFHQLAKAVAETNVAQIYETEIRLGLARIAVRNAKADMMSHLQG